MLIRRLAAENWLWGSRRVLGELKALGIEVSNSTVRRYHAEVSKPVPGQRWSTFFYNHGPYLSDALRGAVDDRARRVLEVLQQLIGSRPGKQARVPVEQWSVVPGDVPKLIADSHGSLLGRRPLFHRARDGPDRYSDAA